MSKKKLNIESVTNELQGASKYFERPKDDAPALPIRTQNLTKPKEISNNKDSKIASKQASMLASSQDSMVQDIRKSVKEVGKETLFLRLTPEEKNQLKDIVYSLSKQRSKISDNEVGRIALNYLLEDYKASGKNSMLAKVIEALNA
jgi:hypothetical protein